MNQKKRCCRPLPWTLGHVANFVLLILNKLLESQNSCHCYQPKANRIMVEASASLVQHLSDSHIDCRKPVFAFEDI